MVAASEREHEARQEQETQDGKRDCSAAPELDENNEEQQRRQEVVLLFDGEAPRMEERFELCRKTPVTRRFVQQYIVRGQHRRDQRFAIVPDTVRNHVEDRKSRGDRGHEQKRGQNSPYSIVIELQKMEAAALKL